MSILLGIQSEVIMRTYYETQQKTTYLVGEIRQGTQPVNDETAIAPLQSTQKP
jgi:hypothetical protein